MAGKCFELVSLAAAFVVSACAAEHAQLPESQVEIVGGQVVQAGAREARSAVFFIDRAGNIGCSGVLVGRNQVLSAAHCFSDDSPWYDVHVAFVTDAKDVRFEGEGRNVRRAIRVMRHEGYNGNFGSSRIPPFDVSLVIFEGSIPDGYQIAPILGEDVALKPGQKATLVGFGKTSDNAKDNGTLRKVETFVGKVRGNAKEIEFGPNAGKGACGGDSGGPAYIVENNTLYLLGLTSRGPTNSCMDGQAIYTDVRYFVDWIESHGNFQVQR